MVFKWGSNLHFNSISVNIMYTDECESNLLFRCQNDACVPPNARCDYHDDCGDGSDEFGCCKSFILFVT